VHNIHVQIVAFISLCQIHADVKISAFPKPMQTCTMSLCISAVVQKSGAEKAPSGSFPFWEVF
jgi:hypothetical protein